MKKCSSKQVIRAVLMIVFVFCVLPTGSALAQELMPVAVYSYYGKTLSSDEMREIASERFYARGEYTDCVYVPSADYSPTRVEAVQFFHCFDSADERRAFSLKLKEEFGISEQSGSADTAEMAEVQPATASIHWSLFAHSFHTGWLGDISVGQSFWTSTGIWSLNDFANNEVLLFDNPSFPGQSWAVGWTVWVLSAGPGGSRHAFHCTSPTC